MIFSSGIAVSEKEAELVKVCSRLTELVAELPDNYHPSYPLVKTVLDCINAKKQPAPETESASVEEIVKARHREYWRKWYAKNKEKRQGFAAFFFCTVLCVCSVSFAMVCYEK